MEALQPAIGSHTDVSKPHGEETSDKYVYGVAGLAKLLGCSVATAQRRISSGQIDKCIIRTGRLIIIDRDAVLKTLKGGNE